MKEQVNIVIIPMVLCLIDWILGWLKISDGKFQQIFSGPNCVLALAGNRDIYFRANVYQYDGVSLSPNQEGTHWVRIEQPKDDKIIFKQVRKSLK